MIDESADFEIDDDDKYDLGSWLSDPESWLHDQIVDIERDPDEYYDELRERRYEIKDDGGKGNAMGRSKRRTET